MSLGNDVNLESVVNSLISQVASLSLQIAQRDAIIAEQRSELDALKKAQINEMDDDS